jgi:hypothetical protein
MQRPGLLNHTIAKNQWIHDVPAGDATPRSHPHGMVAFSHVDQVLNHHESVALGTTHGTLLSRNELPRLHRDQPKTLEVRLIRSLSKPSAKIYFNRLAGFLADS